MVLAIAGLEGPLGAVAGTTFLGLLVILFTLLINALLKTSSKSDEIAQRIVADKDDRIETLEAETKTLKQERDYWFRRYDETRGGTQP